MNRHSRIWSSVGAAGRKGLRLCVLLMVAIGVAAPLQASTIRVEKDGSGDYLEIQDALDFASEGDTVLVGPGRYDTYTQYYSGLDTLDVIAWVTTSNLTIRGTSRADAIIGPQIRTPSTPRRATTCIRVLPGTLDVNIESLSLENSTAGVSVHGRIRVRDVMIRECESKGLVNYSPHPLLIEDCALDENYVGLLLREGDVGTVVRNTSFADNWRGIDIARYADVSVRECTFVGSAPFALQIVAYLNSRVRVSHCVFGEGTGEQSGISLSDFSTAIVDSCRFEPGFGNIGIGAASHVSGTGNILQGGSYVSIILSDRSTAGLLGNDIYQLSGTAILISSYSQLGQRAIDLRGNYWGTQDPDEIESWIHDAQDDPSLAPTVLWEPYRTESVPTEEETVGGLKSLFRRR